MNASCPALRIVSRDDLLHLIEELRENHPSRQWPTIHETQDASRRRFSLGIGSDRARILLNEAKAADLPPDTTPDILPAAFGERVLAQAARAARIRRRQARLLADGSTPERADDVRQLLTDCHTLTLREGARLEAIVEPLVARFEAAERRRMALLQDQPEPAPEAKPDTKPAAPIAAPDSKPNTLTIHNDPRQTDIEAAIALSTQPEPDAAPDISHASTPDAKPDANTQLLDLLTP